MIDPTKRNGGGQCDPRAVQVDWNNPDHVAAVLTQVANETKARFDEAHRLFRAADRGDELAVVMEALEALNQSNRVLMGSLAFLVRTVAQARRGPRIAVPKIHMG